MKNIALIAALIGASSSAFVQAESIDSHGRLHGYTVPFQQADVVENKGQLADVAQFGRLSGYGNAINEEFEVSKGIYANVGEFGRLSGYGNSPSLITDAADDTKVAAR